jgi:hypothetical protein
MDDPLVEQLRLCCVRVLGARPGCGFFINSHVIVTCAHVVGHEVEEGASIGLECWMDGEVQPLDGARVLAMFPADDLALVESPEASAVFAPLEDTAQINQSLVALGFPKRGDRGI